MYTGWEMKRTRPLFVPGMVLPSSRRGRAGSDHLRRGGVGPSCTRPARGRRGQAREECAVASRLLALHDGQQNLKSGAPFGLSDTVIVPPKARTWSRTSARPRPVPRAMPRSWAARPRKNARRRVRVHRPGRPIRRRRRSPQVAIPARRYAPRPRPRRSGGRYRSRW